jgi:hypothetical protein
MDEEDDDLMTGQEENDYSTVATPAMVNPEEIPNNLEPGGDVPPQPIKK